MKVSFWKHTAALCIGLPMLAIGGISIIIIGIFCAQDFVWIPSTVGGLTLLAVVFELFFDQKCLTRVVVSSDGIEETFLKKSVNLLHWYDINEVGVKTMGRGQIYLRLRTKDNEMVIYPTKKIFDAIMILCPSNSVKNQLESLDAYKWYHREKKNKK